MAFNIFSRITSRGAAPPETPPDQGPQQQPGTVGPREQEWDTPPPPRHSPDPQTQSPRPEHLQRGALHARPQVPRPEPPPSGRYSPARPASQDGRELVARPPATERPVRHTGRTALNASRPVERQQVPEIDRSEVARRSAAALRRQMELKQRGLETPRQDREIAQPNPERLAAPNPPSRHELYDERVAATTAPVVVAGHPESARLVAFEIARTNLYTGTQRALREAGDQEVPTPRAQQATTVAIDLTERRPGEETLWDRHGANNPQYNFQRVPALGPQSLAETFQPEHKTATVARAASNGDTTAENRYLYIADAVTNAIPEPAGTSRAPANPVPPKLDEIGQGLRALRAVKTEVVAAGTDVAPIGTVQGSTATPLTARASMRAGAALTDAEKQLLGTDLTNLGVWFDNHIAKASNADPSVTDGLVDNNGRVRVVASGLPPGAGAQATDAGRNLLKASAHIVAGSETGLGNVNQLVVEGTQHMTKPELNAVADRAWAANRKLITTTQASDPSTLHLLGGINMVAAPVTPEQATALSSALGTMPRERLTGTGLNDGISDGVSGGQSNGRNLNAAASPNGGNQGSNMGDSAGRSWGKSSSVSLEAAARAFPHELTAVPRGYVLAFSTDGPGALYKTSGEYVGEYPPQRVMSAQEVETYLERLINQHGQPGPTTVEEQTATINENVARVENRYRDHRMPDHGEMPQNIGPNPTGSEAYRELRAGYMAWAREEPIRGGFYTPDFLEEALVRTGQAFQREVTEILQNRGTDPDSIDHSFRNDQWRRRTWLRWAAHRRILNPNHFPSDF